MLTKLTIGNPGLIFFVDFEGKRVDQSGLPLEKLYVVCARIFQGHVAVERLLLDSYQRQRRILQLAEAPFVGIGDEGDKFGLNDFVGGSLSRGLNFPVRNQQMIFNQFVVQTRLDQMIVVLLIETANGSEESAVLGKEKTARISERAGEACNVGGQVFNFSITRLFAGDSFPSRG